MAPFRQREVEALIAFAPLVVRLMKSKTTAVDAPLGELSDASVESLPAAHQEIWRDIRDQMATILGFLGETQSHNAAEARETEPFFDFAFGQIAYVLKHLPPEHEATKDLLVAAVIDGWLHHLRNLPDLFEVLDGLPVGNIRLATFLLLVQVDVEASVFAPPPVHLEITVLGLAFSCYLAAQGDPHGSRTAGGIFRHFESIWRKVGYREVVKQLHVAGHPPPPPSRLRSLQAKREDTTNGVDLDSFGPLVKAVVLFTPAVVKMLIQAPSNPNRSQQTVRDLPGSRALSLLPTAGPLQLAWMALMKRLLSRRGTESRRTWARLFEIGGPITESTLWQHAVGAASHLTLTAHILKVYLGPPFRYKPPTGDVPLLQAGKTLLEVLVYLENAAAEQAPSGGPNNDFWILHQVLAIGLASYYATTFQHDKRGIEDPFAWFKSGWPAVFVRRAAELHLFDATASVADRRIAALRRQDLSRHRHQAVSRGNERSRVLR